MARLNINVGVKLDDIDKLTKKVQSELNKISKNVKLKISDIDIEGFEKKLSKMSAKLDKLSKEIKPNINTSNIENVSRQIEGVITNLNNLDINIVGKGFDELQAKAKEILGTMNELTNIKYSTDANGNLEKAVISYKNELGQAVTETMKLITETDELGQVTGYTWTTVNRGINENIQKQKKLQEEVNKNEEAFKKLKLSLQDSLNIATKNSLVNPSLLTNLQKRLSGLTIDAPKERVEALQKAINNLASADSRVVKLQNALSTVQEGLEKIKESSQDALKVDTNIAQVEKTEESIKNLKKVLADVKKGNQTLDNTTVSKVIGDLNTNYQKLSTSVKNYNDNIKQQKKLQEETIKTEEAFKKLKLSLQDGLNIATKNSLVNPSLLTNLQKRLSSLTVDTPKERIEALQKAINNLSSADARIVKLQNALSTVQEGLQKIKENSQDALKIDTNIAQIEKTEESIKNLKKVLADVKKGNQTLDSTTVNKTIGDLNKNYQKLSASVKEYESNAKKVAKETENLEIKVSKMQRNLNISSKNELLDPKVISDLQAKLNGINVNTPKSEIKSLETTIANLASSDNRIVKIQQALTTAQNKLTNLKEVSSEALQFEGNVGKLREVENAIKNLEALMTKIKGGDQLISSTAIDKATKEVSNSYSVLSASVSDYNKRTQEAENAQIRLANAQSKLTLIANSGLFNDSAIRKYQESIDNLSRSTKISKEEMTKLEKGINNLGTSAGFINRLEKNIATFEKRLKELNARPIDLMTPEELRQLQTAQGELQNLKNINDSIKSGTAYHSATITRNINATTEAFSGLSGNMRTATTVGNSFGNTLRNISSYMIGGSVVYSTINALKSGIATVKELDTSMRDLKRVTDETEYTYSQFMQKANKTAIELGQTTSGAIDATTTFAQLGYTFEEASEKMSKFAMILSNVGDMSASDSASSLVSILKAFRLESDDTERIVNVLNESGNKFALTTGDLTEGLRIGGASLAIANNSLEESSALIISATEVLRNPTLVANGLKTISMRLRGLADENGELAPKLKETVKSITDVDLTNTNGEFRSTFDILNDIGEKWQELNTFEQSLLAEEIAGKNRANVFTSNKNAPYVQKCA